MTCANCDADALWVYENPGSDDLPFCDKHLPAFLRPLATAGLLRSTDRYDSVKQEVSAALAPGAPKRQTRARRP